MEPNYRQSEILIKIPANEKRREKGEEVKNSHSAARYSFARACTCVTIADILGIPGRKTNIDGTRTFRGLLNALMTSIQPDTAGHAAGFPPISPAISGIHRTCLLCDHAEKVEKKKKKDLSDCRFTVLINVPVKVKAWIDLVGEGCFIVKQRGETTDGIGF